jgi:guanine deaminase
MADITVLDLASPRYRPKDLDAYCITWDAIFPTIMMGDDRAIKDV